MIEEIKNFIKQIVQEELIDKVLIIVEKIKVIATIVIEKFKDLRDCVYVVIHGK